MKKVVISYQNPDMDGVSCMFAYSELLNKLGYNSGYYIWDKPKQEVKIVCDLFNIKLNSLSMLDKNDEYIVVDLNGMTQMHEIITVDNLIEVIDHHSKSKSISLYKNAKIQIETLGAAATLVAERFKLNNIKPSRDSAILLYYGIISNSINLKVKITTSKDIEMAKWLKEQYSEITEDKIEEIFKKKSVIDESNLRKEMECEIPLFLKEDSVIVGQLELVDIDSFLNKRKKEIIEILEIVRKEKNAKYAYLNCIDILNGYTRIVGVDEATNKYVSKMFNIPFENGIGNLNYIIQRKEMTAKLRKIYEI